MIYEVRQNYEGKFYYQILGDTVGPFDTENEAREEGAAALKLVEGTKTKLLPCKGCVRYGSCDISGSCMRGKGDYYAV